jgi:cytoskeletal protein RodZ
MGDFGAGLRAAREAKGLSLRDIAASTKISVAALDGLERDDFSRLPGGIFSRAFVREYAHAVGLDPEATVAEFLAAWSERERDRERGARRPEISADDRDFLERQQLAVRALRVVLVVGAGALLVAMGYFAWAMWFTDAASPAEVPAAARAFAPAPLPPPATAPSAKPADAPSPPLYVALRFSAPCALRVVVDGRVVLDRIVRAGERHTFSASAEIFLDVGNAGGLTWTINGREGRALGPAGAHERARLTRETLASFLAR